MIKYKRILLKLSGEALQGNRSSGIDTVRLQEFAEQIHDLNKSGVEIGIVIGGGNIFRGISGQKSGFDRVKGDYMGMLGTVINGLAIQSYLENLGTKTRCFTAISMEPVGERFSKSKALTALDRSEVTIFTFGTGNPFFTTDTAAALRAVEIKADVLLKGTRVDGVFNADPEKVPDATRYDKLTYSEAIKHELQVMDLTAFTLCRENNLPIIVFNMNQKGSLKKIVSGEKIGTLIKN